MKRQVPHGGKRLEDRVACQLVAKGEAIAVDAEHARRDAVSEARGIAPRDLREEPHLAVSADDSGGIERRPARLRETGRPGQDGVPNRRRDRVRSAGQGLGREERVAGGPAMKLDGVESAALSQAPYGRLR